jgi:hypothetical protein
MEVSRHCGIEKDFKNLKRFPTAKESLEAWERLFCLKGVSETPAIEAYPGFGQHKIFKGRVVPLKENVGKSKGYRVIFEMISESRCIILVFSRHGVYNSEVELAVLIKERIISSF